MLEHVSGYCWSQSAMSVVKRLKTILLLLICYRLLPCTLLHISSKADHLRTAEESNTCCALQADGGSCCISSPPVWHIPHALLRVVRQPGPLLWLPRLGSAGKDSPFFHLLDVSQCCWLHFRQIESAVGTDESTANASTLVKCWGMCCKRCNTSHLSIVLSICAAGLSTAIIGQRSIEIAQLSAAGSGSQSREMRSSPFRMNERSAH